MIIKPNQLDIKLALWKPNKLDIKWDINFDELFFLQMHK